MAGDTSSNIFINIDTSQAMAQLRALEKELTALNRSLVVGTKTAAQAQSKYAQSLLHNVNATGQWTASMTRMRTATEQFSSSLDKSKLSLKEYFRFGVASSKTFGRVFGNEFDTVSKLVEKRVKTLQQQYVQLGRDAQGAMNALKFTPKALNYRDVTTQLMMATQRQQIFNKLLDDGATKLLNFGKNTQWAGRQLMVGFTIPLMLFSAQAIRSFKEIETQVLRFKKVYGDIFTDQGATEQALKNIRKLGDEYTKYGLKVSETIKMASDAAAAGFTGKGLEDLVEQTNKLAVLGGIAQDQALETTIALRNAFQVDQGDLKGTIDFLNAVENQTVLALEDVTEAVPRVGPIIKELGGDVKDLAFFLAAMKEGGVSAAQGANALKSGLASLINPSKKATQAAADLGINLKGIVEENAGNLRATVTAFATALQPLTDLQQQRIIEQIFGKYQFARISALLNNITRDGTQAERVLRLASASAEELALLTERELRIQAESPMNKFVGAIERLRKAIAPVGEVFAKAFTPIIEFVTKIAEKFNNMPDSFKRAVAIILGVLGILGPVFLMTFGLIANGVANSLKGFNLLRKGFQQLAYGSSDVALKTQYLTQEELENISVTNALYSKHEQLSAAYRLEAQSLMSLIGVYNQANIAMGGFAGKNPGLFVPGKGGAPKRFADGTLSVPGPRGAGDVIPSMLSPGEAVIPAKQSEKYSGFISQIIQDRVPGFIRGLNPYARTSFATNFDDLTFGASRAATQATGGFRPSLSVIGRQVIPQLPGLRFIEEGKDLIKVIASDNAFFYVKKSKLADLQSKLEEHHRFMVSTGRAEESLAEIVRQVTRTGRGRVAREAFQGKTITPSQLYSRLPKWSQERVRTQGIEVANKRYDLLLKSRNPHLLKLKNYLETEEKQYLQKVLPPEVFSTLNFDAKRLAPSHIREVGTDRTGSWTPNKIARDWDWFNKALIGTKMGNVSGGHPLNSKQANEIIQHLLLKRQFKKSLGKDLSARQQGLLAALQYRVNRKPSFYDDFVLVDNAMMKRMPRTMNLADGIISVPGPKGAGDIQPAMLAPGEAVVPAKQSEKYKPLLQSIIADKVPGFQNANDPWGDGYTTRPSGIIIPPGAKLDDPWDKPSSIPPTRTDKAIDRIFSTKFGRKIEAAFDNIAEKANAAAPKVGALGQNAADAADTTNKMTKQELQNARQLKQMNSAGRMMGVGMAASMLPMAGMAQASQNPDGFLARNMSALTSVAMLSMLLPILNTPAKLLAGAAAGYAAILIMQSKQIKKAIIEGNNLAEQFAMTTDKLEKFGSVTGRMSITQVEQQKRLGRTTVSGAASLEFGESFLQGDAGKKFQEDFTQLRQQYEGAVAGQIAVAQLASAVNQGVLSYLQAESIITKMARDLEDPNLEFQMQGQLIKILGPDGVDITKNPLKVQVELLTAQRGAFDVVTRDFQKISKEQLGGILGIGSLGEAGGLTAGALTGGALAFKAYSMSLAAIAAEAGAATTGLSALSTVVRSVGPGKIVAVGAAIGTLATRIFQSGKEAEKIGKAAGLVQGVAVENLRSVQQSVDALNYQYDLSIANLQVEKNRTTNLKEIERITERIATLEFNRKSDLQELYRIQKDTIDMYVNFVSNVEDPGVGQKILDQLSDPMSWLPFSDSKSQKQAKKLMDAAIIGMEESWKNSIGAKLLGEELRGMETTAAVKIALLVESKAISPEQYMLLKKVAEAQGKDINQVINFIIKSTDIDTLSRIAILTERFEKFGAKKKFVGISEQLAGDPEKLKNVLTALEEYAKAPETIPVNLDMEIDPKDIEQLSKFGKEINAIRSRFPDGKFDIKLLQKYQTELEGAGLPANATLDYVIDNIDYFNKLPAEKRFEAIFAMKVLTDADSVAKDVEKTLRIAFMKEAAKGNVAIRYVDTAAAQATKDFDKWFKSAEGVKKYREELERLGIEWKGLGDTEKDVNLGDPLNQGDQGPKRDYSWLGDLAQRLKLFKEASLDATKPLKSIRDFFDPKRPNTINNYLQENEGALEDIEDAAREAGMTIDKQFMDIIRGLDPEQFKLWSEILFEIGSDKRISGLKDDFTFINNAFKRDTIMSFIDAQRQSNDETEQQVAAFNLLTKNGWNSVEAMKALEDPAFRARTAAAATAKDVGFWKEEAEEYKKELNRIIPLQYALANNKLFEDTEALEKQSKAFDILNKKGIERSVILEIIKNKAFAYAIAEGAGYDDLVTKVQKYLDLLKEIEAKSKTWEQATKEAIDKNVAALDIQARILQNTFDRETFQLKIDISNAQDEVDRVNNLISEEQKKIDKINYQLKIDPVIGDFAIEDLQEKINDAQRVIEEQFDRPINALQDRSSILSNDLTLMDKAAEAVNEKYDLQQKALQQISEINQDILNQQKQQIDLADALTQGDISAAARAAQEMRSTATEAASRGAGGMIEVARDAELSRIVSATGMTRKQIEEEQFAIGQKIFNLEQQRKVNQAEIVKLEDDLYARQELREQKLLAIRVHETEIDRLRNNDLLTAETRLTNLQNELDKKQKMLDAELGQINAKKLQWEAVQNALDLYEARLDELKNGSLKSMLDMIKDIAEKLAGIGISTGIDTSVTGFKFNGNSSTATENAKATAAAIAATAEAEAAEALAAEAAAAAAAADAAALLAANSEASLAAAEAIAELEKLTSEFASEINASNNAMKIRLIKKLEKSGKKVPNSLLNRGGGSGSRGAAFMSFGGVVPKYMASGGKIGSDTVPAMLTPGEFVVNKASANAFGPLLSRINDYKYPRMTAPSFGVSNGNPVYAPVSNIAAPVNNNSNSVYNYNIDISVGGTNATPDSIANAVLNELKYIDAQRIRGQRVS